MWVLNFSLLHLLFQLSFWFSFLIEWFIRISVMTTKTKQSLIKLILIKINYFMGHILLLSAKLNTYFRPDMFIYRIIWSVILIEKVMPVFLALLILKKQYPFLFSPVFVLKPKKLSTYGWDSLYKVVLDLNALFAKAIKHWIHKFSSNHKVLVF